MIVGACFMPINMNLAYKIIPCGNEGDADNHTDGHVPGKSPDIAAL